MVRIDRRGTVVVITDDPKNHTHEYYDSIKDAIDARRKEFADLIPEPFTLLLEYDAGHDSWNVMTKNPNSSLKKNYRPLYKKRPAVFIRNAKNVKPLFEELGIEYTL